MSRIKLVNKEGLNPNAKEQLEKVAGDQKALAKGIGGDPIYEPVPEYIQTSSDKVYHNGHNAWIVLGRDRPRSRLSGYGGQGNTHCASLDFVAGRMGANARAFDAKGRKIYVDPDFETDAARIYISQRTDVDDNFKLARGKVGNSKTKSAVALKADGVRVIAREGIKLVTGGLGKNSQGGDIRSITGIDLIAGNDDTGLEPMAKGKKLEEALKRLTHHVDKLAGIVDAILMSQMAFNEKLTHHFHYSPFFGLPTTPSPPVVAAGIKTTMDHTLQGKKSLISHKANLQTYKHNYLSPAGAKYILSRYNNVN